MQILVTGATGFTGSWILKTLKEKYPEAEVVGTGRNIERTRMLRKEGHTIVNGDLSDEYFVQNELQGFTAVVHCAAKSSDWGSSKAFFRSNVLATRHLLHHISTVEKFVHISSSAVYAAGRHRLNIKESDPLPSRFINQYAKTKHMADQLVLNYRDRPVQRIILRPRAIIGPGDTISFPRIIKAHEQGKLKIVGDGKNLTTFTSVQNMAHAVYLALEADLSISGEVFNICDGESTPMWPLLARALKKLGHTEPLKKVPYRLVYFLAAMNELGAVISGKPPVMTRYGVDTVHFSTTLDIAKAKEMLGYEPIVSTEETINAVLQEYLTVTK